SLNVGRWPKHSSDAGIGLQKCAALAVSPLYAGTAKAGRETRMVDLLGAWSLLSCTNIRGEDAATAYGDPPAGQIQYTADGRMSAFLMDPAWVERGNQLADGFTEFFSYGGTWKRDGDSITHHVMFSSHPQ